MNPVRHLHWRRYWRELIQAGGEARQRLRAIRISSGRFDSGQHQLNAHSKGKLSRSDWFQDGLLQSEKLLDGFDAAARIGNADSVRSAQLVMHQEFTHLDNPQIRLHHAPDLSGFQGWGTDALDRLDFDHALSCTLTGDENSQIAR